MGLLANALVTLDDQKDYIGVENTDKDLILEKLINSISSLFDVITNRNLKEKTDTTLYLDGNGEKTISLPNYPVASIAKVEEDDITLTEGTTSDYLLYSSNQDAYLYKVSGVWTTSRKGIKLTTFKSGFNPVPQDLQFACLKQVAHEFQQFTSHSWGEQSRTFPDGSVSFVEKGLLDDVKKIVLGYRKLT